VLQTNLFEKKLFFLKLSKQKKQVRSNIKTKNEQKWAPHMREGLLPPELPFFTLKFEFLSHFLRNDSSNTALCYKIQEDYNVKSGGTGGGSK
jgi:hypothetical protein